MQIAHSFNNYPLINMLLFNVHTYMSRHICGLFIYYYYFFKIFFYLTTLAIEELKWKIMWKSGLKRRHTYRILKQGLKGLVYAASSWSNKDYYVI